MEPALQVLVFAPDARSAAIGDAGIATSADVNSQHWNAAKYVFAANNGGVGLSYTPWLRDATSDIDITYLSGFYRFANNQSLSASLRFFSLGTIELYTEDAQYLQSIKPSEYAFDIAYSRRLGRYFSGGITFRYINSSKVIADNTGSAVVARTSNIATDVAFYYQKPANMFGEDIEIAFGTTVSNLGTKLEISDSAVYFLPMRLGLGLRAACNINSENKVSAIVELKKSLVPSNSGYRNSDVPGAAIKGVFSDFSQMIYVVGAEYSYKNALVFRTGYHRESKLLSDNSYITFGIGAVYENLHFAASYLFVTGNEKTAMNNTYRISFAWLFGSIRRYDL
ncbi:MAG: type IX secretion system outer membrane channel protein PorV [Prevotellaceae bacterium]|nr:type IX secretion system outer membrane channel protein PorV [Prevotellaceae bacterium]